MKENSAHYEFSLTNQFFADIDAPEIQKGKLQVQLDVKKTMGIYVLNFHIEGSGRTDKRRPCPCNRGSS